MTTIDPLDGVPYARSKGSVRKRPMYSRAPLDVRRVRPALWQLISIISVSLFAFGCDDPDCGTVTSNHCSRPPGGRRQTLRGR